MAFNRIIIVTIGGLPISSGIKISYEIYKKDTKDPNKAIIKLYNLSEITKRLISLVTDTPVIISAGYLDIPPAPIFVGRLKYATSMKEDGNVITQIEALDDARGFNSGISVALPIGATASSIIALASAQLVAPLATPLTGDSIYQNGFSFIGTVKKLLDMVVRDRLKLDWSVQDNLLYVLDPALPRVGAPIVLSPANGLIGSVQVEKDETNNLINKAKKQEDKITFESLLIQRAGIGLTVALVSSNFTGTLKIKELTMMGDSRDGRMINQYVGTPLI